MKKKNIGLLLGSLAVAIGGAISYYQQPDYDGDLQTFTEQKQVLEKNYPDFASYTKLDKASQSFPVPGLVKTQSLNVSTNKAGTAKDMDPQGIVKAGKYLLITAYSHSHKYDSVIQVLAADNGKYLKTIVLESTFHVGGITYDPINKKVWICTLSAQNKAQVASIDLAIIEKADFSKDQKAIDFNQEVNLGKINQASFICYQKNSLYIGFFDQNNDGLLTRYDLQKDGSFDKDFGKTVNLKSGNHLSMPEKIYSIDQKMQGMTFYKNKIILSKSFGPTDSELLVYDYTGNDINLDTDAVQTIKAPPYLEQTYTDGNTLYTLFESGSIAYRNKAGITVVDRVLQLDLTKIILKK